MQEKQFNDIIQNAVESCLTTLTEKNASYNPNEDKLAGFKTAARMRGVTPLQALSGMKVKHTSFVQDVLEGRIPIPSEEVVQEKFGDEINYLFLALALIEEMRAEENTSAAEILQKTVASGFLSEDQVSVIRSEMADQLGVSIANVKPDEHDLGSGYASSTSHPTIG